MVITGPIGQIGVFRPDNQGLSINEPIRGSMSVHDRLGAGSVCMNNLVGMSAIF